jgi:hypothetical protein
MANILDDEIPGFKYRYTGPEATPSSKVGVTVSAGPTDEQLAAAKAKVDLSNLTPEIKERLDLLNKLYKEDTKINPKGEDLPITSGYRTREQQRQLYLDRLKNPNLVAEPGKSRHEGGNAIDLHPRVPDSLLAQVGFHRPHGAKDMYHVEVNPNSDFQLTPYDVNMDEEAPGFKFKYNPTKVTAAEELGSMLEDAKSYPKRFAKEAASLADVALGTAPALAQFALEPVAKLIDRVGDTKVAQEALTKATSFFDKPVGKFFGITNDPIYNAEGARQVMDYAAEHADKGAQWVADNTGMSKSDAAWFINAAMIKAAPTAGRAVKKTASKVAEVATAENAGNLLAEISGKMTNTSPYNTKRGFEAGYQKNPAILEASKEGAVSAPEIVGNVREAFQAVKNNRKEAYKQSIASTKGNQVFLDFKPIREAFDKTVDSLKSKNLGVEASKVGPETNAKVKEIETILNEWERKPALHTAAGLDDLKQRIDDVYSQGMTDQAKRVMTETRNKVKDTISKQDPNYEKTMADYEQGLKLEREIQQALGLGEKTGVDTTIRKLAQVFSNKSTLSKQYRLELLQELERVGGKNLIDKLAGYAMGQTTPGALQLLADLNIGAGTWMLASPEAGATTLAAIAAAQSPKLALYGSYGAGRATRALSDVGQVAKAQVEKGKTKLSEITSRK